MKEKSLTSIFSNWTFIISNSILPSFYPIYLRKKAIVFFKKMMARKKKMTAFKKNAVVFQSKRGRILKKRHSAWKDLPKVKGVKGGNTTFFL